MTYDRDYLCKYALQNMRCRINRSRLGFQLPDRKRPDIDNKNFRLPEFCQTGTGCLDEEILGFRNLPENLYEFVFLASIN